MNIFKNKIHANKTRRSRIVLAIFITTGLLTNIGVFSPIMANAANDSTGNQAGNPGECPEGYDKIADDMNEGLSWEADKDYESVILVGGPENDDANNDPDGRDKYFSNVEKGETIEREEHDISHICAIPAEIEEEDQKICLSPDNLEDDEKVSFSESFGENEETLQEILDLHSFGLNADDDQKNYQVWYSDSASSTIEITVEFLASYADNGNVFGYYINGDLNTFEPLFKNKNHSDFAQTPIASSTGYSVSVDITGAEEIGFAIHTEGNEGKDVRVTENDLNDNEKRHAVVYDGTTTGEYVIAFEDLKDPGDEDFNDMVVKVTVNDCQISEPPVEEEGLTATVVAHKIVCEDESEMPNYGEGGPDIDENTAAEWVDEHNSCELVRDWEFQWAPEGTSNPDDPTENPLYGEAEGDWSTFGPTDTDGKATLELTAEDIDGMSNIWVREVLKDGYIPFTYGPSNESNEDDHSAELYCHSDVLNYDNYDEIYDVEIDNTYHCVAWNMPINDNDDSGDGDDDDNGDAGDGDNGDGDNGDGDNDSDDNQTTGSVSGAYVQAKPVDTSEPAPEGDVAGASDSIAPTSTPEEQVQGEQDSIVPVGAPNTGMGGTSSEQNRVTWPLTLISIVILGIVFFNLKTPLVKS